MGLQYISSLLRQEGFQVEILDPLMQGYDLNKTFQEIFARDFKILGITIPFQRMIKPTLSLINNLRANGIKAHITIGGYPPTFSYENILNNYQSVDSVVRGEGEYTLMELTRKICADKDWTDIPGIAYKKEHKVIVNQPRPLIKDLDSIPWPDRDFVKKSVNKISSVSVSASRGCYSNCSFCSIVSFYKQFPGPKWRIREPNQVVNEIEHCHKNLKINNIFFVDDDFIGPGKIGRNRAYKIAEEIIRRKLKVCYYISCRADNVDKELFILLKQSGLTNVFLGIESGNQETLDIFNKRITVERNIKAVKILQDLEINYDLGFIMFNPYTTIDKIREDIEFFKQINVEPGIMHMNQLSIFPGMPLIERLEKDKILKDFTFGYEYDFIDKKVKNVVNALDNIKPRIFPLYKEIYQLNKQIRLIEHQFSDEMTIKNIRQEYDKLKNDFIKSINQFLTKIIEIADKNKNPLFEIDKHIKNLIDNRLTDLSKRVSKIKKLQTRPEDKIEIKG